MYDTMSRGRTSKDGDSARGQQKSVDFDDEFTDTKVGFDHFFSSAQVLMNCKRVLSLKMSNILGYKKGKMKDNILNMIVLPPKNRFLNFI